MRILIIGFSKIAQNRILPALLKIPEVTAIDIASERSAKLVSGGIKNLGSIFDNYEDAFNNSNAELVYVSTVNIAHAGLVEKALRKMMHVIVDKPAFTDFNDAQRLVELARKSGLCLAESLVYAYHEQIKIIEDMFSKTGSSPQRLLVNFSIPPMPEDNFRYSRELGGGALFDLGPYAVSVGRIFFDNEVPQELFARVCSRGGKDEIDISFSMMALYSKGRSMTGHFGFDTQYRNHLDLLSPDISVSLDRIFTTTPDLENQIQVQRSNKKELVSAPKCDSFLVFLKSVFAAIRSGSYDRFSDDLLADSALLSRLRKAALGG
ncbi:MAG: Gfo/Idh/MocA family oxidoreductase [Candidatus Omnitrophota bacterium]